MKKTILILLVLIFMTYPTKAQDKITPDGYVGKVSLVTEFGINQSEGRYLEFIPGLNSFPQKINSLGPFVKIQVCLPSTESFTLFTNGYFSSLSGNEDGGYIKDMKYNQLSFSLGFKLYFK